MFEGKSVRASLGKEGIVELCFDAQGQSVNKLDVGTVDEIAAATKAIAASGAARGVLVTSAKDVFIVGADIFEFTSLFMQPEAMIEAHIARVNRVFTAFEDLDVPSVATVNGLALGGGLEMALTCDARVMSETTQIGLPWNIACRRPGSARQSANSAGGANGQPAARGTGSTGRSASERSSEVVDITGVSR